MARIQASESVSVRQKDDSGDINPAQQEVDGIVEEEDITNANDWDPLRSPAKESFAEKEPAPDMVPVLEEGLVVHAPGQDVLLGDEKGGDLRRVQSPTSATSRHAPDLHLDLKSALPSSQPWDTDGPLDSLAQRKPEYHESGSAAQPKFPPCVVNTSFGLPFPVCSTVF